MASRGNSRGPLLLLNRFDELDFGRPLRTRAHGHTYIYTYIYLQNTRAVHTSGRTALFSRKSGFLRTRTMVAHIRTRAHGHEILCRSRTVDIFTRGDPKPPPPQRPPQVFPSRAVDRTSRVFPVPIARARPHRRCTTNIHTRFPFSRSIRLHRHRILFRGPVQVIIRNETQKNRTARRRKKKKKTIVLINVSVVRVAQKDVLRLTREQAAELYSEHATQLYFARLTEHMSSGPVVVYALAKKNCVDEWRRLIGPADVSFARRYFPVSLRAVYGTELGTAPVANAFHGSDSPAAAKREIRFFFPDSTCAFLPSPSTSSSRACVCVCFSTVRRLVVVDKRSERRVYDVVRVHRFDRDTVFGSSF